MIRAVTASLVCAVMLAVAPARHQPSDAILPEHFISSSATRRNVRCEVSRNVSNSSARLPVGMLSNGAVSSPAPTIVIAFENDKSFTPFNPVQGRPVSAAGYFCWRWGS